MAIPLAALGIGLLPTLLGSLFGGGRPNNNEAELAAQRERDAAADARAREVKAQGAQEAARLQADTDTRTKQETDFTNQLGQLRSSEGSAANDLISSYGLDPNQFAPKIEQGFTRATSSLAPGADLTQAVNGRSIAQTILDDELRSRRIGYTQQAEQKFGTDFGSRLISDDILDETINSIIGTQKQGALDYVDRGVARGIFNPQGESAARNSIGTSYEAGRSQLGSLADGVIGNYRTQADQVRDRAFSSAQGYNFGSNIDFDSLLGQGNDIAERAQTRGSGDLLNQVGGQQFFDLGSIRNTGGEAQGTINNRDTAIGSALEDRKRRAAVGRGLGSQGAF